MDKEIQNNSSLLFYFHLCTKTVSIIDIRKTKSQRLADQIMKIIKNDWFSELEIFEIDQHINRETCKHDPNAVTETKYRKKKQNTQNE